MACVNHPSVPTAATCKSCGVELCGTCARFLEYGEYCEKCAVVAEADAYLRKRNRSQEVHQAEVAQATAARDAEVKSRNKSQDRDRLFIWSGVGGASLMLFAAMGLYAFPDLLIDDVVLAAQQDQVRLEECRQVFQAIGIMLSEGQLPEDNMRCPGSTIPNIVSRDGSLVRVSHPNPGQFGLQALYVTNESHRVVMEEGQS